MSFLRALIGEELRERIGFGAFDLRWLGLRALVAEENVAVVGADCSGEVLREHLGASEAELLIFDDVAVGGGESREVVGLGSHGGRS